MVKKFRRLTATIFWIMTGALFGALATVALCFIRLPVIIDYGISLLVIPMGMLFIAFHVKSIKTNILNLIVLYINSAFLGGTFQLILYHTTLNHYLYVTRRDNHFQNNLGLKFAAGLPAVICLAILFVNVCLYHAKEHQRKCWVCLVIHGVRIDAQAFIDTGNGLYEPISGHPVCVISCAYFKKYFKTSDQRKIRVIPMDTIGGNGILYAVSIDGMEVYIKNQVYCYKHVYTALEEKEFNGCQVLLHPDFAGMEKAG